MTTGPAARIVDLTMTLRYRHGLGALSPYFAGLEAGVARGTRCASCGRVWFPPRLICTCGSAKLGWLELSGEGTIRHATEGPATLPLSGLSGVFVFGLIALDGASNLAFGRIAGDRPARAGARVRLAAAPRGAVHPAQACVYRML